MTNYIELIIVDTPDVIKIYANRVSENSKGFKTQTRLDTVDVESNLVSVDKAIDVLKSKYSSYIVRVTNKSNLNVNGGR